MKPHILDVQNQLRCHPQLVYPQRKLDNIRFIAVHHSLTREGSAESFARYHVDNNGWPGIGYHFVIEKDGTIKKCHELTTISYHVGDSNRLAVGICLTGDFRVEQPSKAQYHSLLRLVRWLQKILPRPVHVKGHSEFPGYSWKKCPALDMDQVRKDIEQFQEGRRLELESWQLELAEKAIDELAQKKGRDGHPLVQEPEKWKTKLREGKVMEDLPWLFFVIINRIAQGDDV